MRRCLLEGFVASCGRYHIHSTSVVFTRSRLAGRSSSGDGVVSPTRLCHGTTGRVWPAFLAAARWMRASASSCATTNGSISGTWPERTESLHVNFRTLLRCLVSDKCAITRKRSAKTTKQTGHRFVATNLFIVQRAPCTMRSCCARAFSDLKPPTPHLLHTSVGPGAAGNRTETDLALRKSV